MPNKKADLSLLNDLSLFDPTQSSAEELENALRTVLQIITFSAASLLTITLLIIPEIADRKMSSRAKRGDLNNLR
jgi:hypothetical protein